MTGNTTLDQERAAAEIRERLGERFPAIPGDTIAAAVQQARDSFARARVRDFVPVLVEREAPARLERPV
ncbi:hypothetical protein QWJ90_06810 [Microbacterium oryzae]|uniref:three-helix bundle dimerization domain-containing protein n=1 Tax=Microbacterium oryzae TaxID=743009 RepID=UPI0025B1D7EE|nr:hypothetical protein [Microbacterium oryzae]MDN3310636.1 hypothetical protein [Microbacterium oryzae]